MQISGAGSLSGDGTFATEFSAPVLHTVSFTIYDSNLPATMTGDAPSIPDTLTGATFTIPSQGNMTRTETSLYWNGSSMQTVYHNISLLGWTDGNGLHYPGETYSMPNSDVTFKAIWNTNYAPVIETIIPDTLSIGDTLVVTGINLASTEFVEFDYGVLADTFTVISDEEIRVVVPVGAESGTLVVQNYSGSFDWAYEAITIV